MIRSTTIALAAAFFLSGCLPPAIYAQPNTKVRLLESGQSLESALEAGQTLSFTLKFTANQYARVLVEQQNLDVVLKVLTADGKTLVESDNPNPSGLESLTLLTPPAGLYQLQIQASDKTAAGKCVVKLDEVRAATADDQDRIAAERLFLEAEQLSRQDKPRALEKYEAALQIRRRLADHFDEAVLLHCLGQLWAASDSPEKASAAYRQALTLFQSASGQGWDGMFSNLSFLYTIMGSKQKALNYLEEAVPLVRALRNRRLEAVLLVGIAKIHEDLNQQPQELEQLHNALQLYRASGGRAGETITLTNIGDADLTLAEKQKAIQYLNQSLLLVRAVGDKSLEATIIFGLAYVYNLLDERQKALEYYEQALPLFRALQDRNSEAYVLNFIGGFYYGVGEYQKASDYFEQALPLFRAVKDQNAEAYALCYLGAVNYQLGNQQQALNYQQQGLTLFRTAADHYGEAVARSNLSVLHWQQGDKQQALVQQQQALQLWRAIGYRSGEASALNDLGVIAAAGGDMSTALRHHQQALTLFRLLGNRTGESYALYGLARLARARGSLQEARTQIEAALDIIESLRAQITSPELRASYLSTQQPLYNFHIEILMQLHQQRPQQGFDGVALQASERARGRSLLEILTEAQIDLRQGVDAALLARERQVQKQLNAKEHARLQLANRKPTPEQIAATEKELRALTAEYQEIQAQIRARSPRYAALTQPQPLTLKEIQQQVLDEDTLLLEYALGEERSYLWAVTPTSLTSYALPKRAVIETAARTFYETVTSPELQFGAAKSINQLREASTQLSQMLLAPVAAHLGNKRLLIVADGALQYVPFAALPGPKDERGTRTVKGLSLIGQPLVTDHEIVSLPSASVLTVLRRETAGRPIATKTLALVADPVFSPNDARVKAIGPNTAEKASTAQRERQERLNRAVEQSGVKSNDLRIPRLPGTRREAAAILEFVPEAERKQSFDFEANRATVTGQELAQYRLIHLATHGLLNSTHPELSGLVLSLVDQQGTPQDGFLRLHEIYNLRLPADLIVLSACQTALGKEIRGEGLVGLTRGFMYAGAPRVVASLWKVDDKATAELMRRFYRAMLQEPRLRPAAALRAAQIEMLKQKEWEAPYYWSAFILQGEWK